MEKPVHKPYRNYASFVEPRHQHAEAGKVTRDEG